LNTRRLELLENKHKEKTIKLQERHTKKLKKSLNDLKEELESKASSSAVKNTEVQKNLDNLQKQLEEEKTRSQTRIATAEADKEQLEKDVLLIKDELNQTKSQVSYVKQKSKIKKEQARKKHLEEISTKQAELEDVKKTNFSNKSKNSNSKIRFSRKKLLN